MKVERWQRDFIRRLAKAGICGTTEREVLWWMLQYAIFEMTKSEYIKKYFEMRDLVRLRSERPDSHKEKK